MNIEKLDELISKLESVPDQNFDMKEWRKECSCGTVACAGGWAESLGFGHTTAGIAKTLKISYEEADELFYPSETTERRYENISRQDAIRVLHHLRNTGRVNWGLLDD